MVTTYVRPPPMMVKGQGCYLWDMENRRFLDLTAGIAVNALGHCDPEITKIIAQQVSLSTCCKRRNSGTDDCLCHF
jgi:acetylornithine aminotransferase